MVDVVYYPQMFSGNWEDTITELEQVIGAEEIKARQTYGFISFTRMKPVSSSDYSRSTEVSDHANVPYTIIKSVFQRPSGEITIKQIVFVVTGLDLGVTT